VIEITATPQANLKLDERLYKKEIMAGLTQNTSLLNCLTRQQETV